MYLRPDSLKAAAEFLNSPLWADIKDCLRARKPEKPGATDASHVAAHRAFQRVGFEECIEEIENLPFDIEEIRRDPLDRPALDPRD